MYEWLFGLLFTQTCQGNLSPSAITISNSCFHPVKYVAMLLAREQSVMLLTAVKWFKVLGIKE